MEDINPLSPNDEVRQIVGEAMQAALREADAGNTGQAQALYRAILELQPGHAGACHALGSLARQAGQAGEAVRYFADALQGDPGHEAYWLDYLETLIETRQFATARALLDLARTHGLQPAAIDVLDRQLIATGAPDSETIDAAVALFAQGRLNEADQAARALTARFPQHAFGWKLLGGVLELRGDLAQALAAMEQASACAPDDAETLSNLGLLLKNSARLAEAEAVLRRAVALQPGNPHAHNHLAITLLEMGRLTEAHASASTAVTLAPVLANAGNTLAMILQHQSRTDEAVDAYRRLLAHDPDHTDAHSNMLFCMSQMSAISADELFAEHCRFGQRVAARAGTSHCAWDRQADPERPLRVGFVSGDLRSHALANFIEPVLERLAGRPGVAMHAYYTYPRHDAVTERLRGHMAHWRDVGALDDSALVQLIQADGIDILIDLSGHTAYNRLPVFARKPAPLQASWIGYPGTTGLKAMDYYLTDRVILPPGQYDHLFTEKLIHLPVSAPFQPAANAPELVPPPALANGYVTFGSFNRLSKISRDVVGTWSRLLRAMPDARLLVAGMPEHGHQLLMSWLEQEAIAPRRLAIHGRVGMHDYLALHNQVDICLDTFPYSGGTTTLHALWMGVPTLTLAGDTASGRQTACILEHNNLMQYIARDADEFVAKGVAASTDLAGLTMLRAHARARFAQPSADVLTQLADSIEQALRLMWRRWCEGLPAAAFEVPLVSPSPAPVIAEAGPVPAPALAPLYVTQPDLPPLADFVASLEQIWESKFLTNGGQFHQRLEAALCRHLGVDYISLFANGTLALMTALQALGIKGEVITTPYSFAATSHALLWNGLQPVFADIDPQTFNLDPARIEAAITPNTSAIMPVHCYGNPCDVDAIDRIARKHGLKVIYDAAHAFGVRQDGTSILRHGDLSVLSFHATKVFTTFEGGAIVCHDAATKRHIDLLKNFGIADEQTIVAAGINGKMNEVSAAFGLLQLETVAAALDKRRQVAAHYRRLLEAVDGIDPMQEGRHAPNYGYFPVLVRAAYPLTRDALYEKLRAAGVYARRYFYPLISQFPMYRQIPSASPSNLERAATVASQVICLPIYPALETQQIEHIVSLITSP